MHAPNKALQLSILMRMFSELLETCHRTYVAVLSAIVKVRNFVPRSMSAPVAGATFSADPLRRNAEKSELKITTIAL